MSADIFKHKIARAIQLKWTFLALKWAAFCLKIVSKFSKKATPANNKQNLNIMQLKALRYTVFPEFFVFARFGNFRAAMQL